MAGSTDAGIAGILGESKAKTVESAVTGKNVKLKLFRGDANGGSYPDRVEQAEDAVKEKADRLKELKAKDDATEDEKAELESLENAAALPDKLNGEWKRRSALGRRPPAVDQGGVRLRRAAG